MLQPAYTVALLGVAIAIYVVCIRPTIRNLPHIQGLYDQADTFWQRLGARMRAQWDIIVSTVLIVLPELPGLLQQIQGADMSAFVPGDKVKMINQGIGLALIILRAVNLKKTGG